MDFNSFKTESGKYSKKSINILTRRTITEHFVFDLNRSKLRKKISKKLKFLIPGVKSRPKDIWMSSISNEMRYCYYWNGTIIKNQID